VAKHTDNVKY